jgi:N utilization substance protein A
MNKEIANLITQIARIRNVDTTYVCETLKLSVIAGLKRRFGPESRAEVYINAETGDLNVYILKTVVAEVKDESAEIALTEAEKIKPGVKRGEDVKIEIPPADIGRIAIRKASEELMLKLREAERTKLYDEYTKKRSEIVSGTIQKIGRDEIIINLGLVEGTLAAQEQLKSDHYRQGAPIKALVYRVERTPIGPRILLSRTHPDFLKRLLAKEIPEIRQGIVEIRAVARAPSFRSKVAVFSADERIDPVGACVGYRKSRIDGAIKELSGEKIDIVQWSKDMPVFIARALGPAKVKQVVQEGETYIVVVPDDEFSIAIGKKGQNVWLASVLVGAKLEVLKETDYNNRAIMNKAAMIALADLNLGEALTTQLHDSQILTAFDLLSIRTKDLAEATGLEPDVIDDLKKDVDDKLKLMPGGEEPEAEAEPKTEDRGPETGLPSPVSGQPASEPQVGEAKPEEKTGTPAEPKSTEQAQPEEVKVKVDVKAEVKAEEETLEGSPNDEARMTKIQTSSMPTSPEVEPPKPRRRKATSKKAEPEPKTEDQGPETSLPSPVPGQPAEEPKAEAEEPKAVPEPGNEAESEEPEPEAAATPERPEEELPLEGEPEDAQDL